MASHPGAALLAGKVAIVTGAAMGIGKGIARVFAREGAQVIAADIDPVVDDAAAEIGSGCVAIRCDVSKEAEVAAMFAQAVERFGRVDIIVNNAGTIYSPEPELSLANYQAFTDVNLLGVMLCTREAVKVMEAQGGGAIINVSSVGSLAAEERAPMVYSAAKAAVNSLTKSIAVRYGGKGIRANVLAPGFTHIEKTRYSESPHMAVMEKKSPIGRAADPEEQAQAAVFLASDRASFINGVVLPVDGGWSVRMV